jgi:IS5 family transposase
LAPKCAAGCIRWRPAADINRLPKLLHGNERALYGDQAYWSAAHREAAEFLGIRYPVNRQPNGNESRTTYKHAINRSRARARGEHAFRVVKCLWGFTKVRYPGLAKNTARLFTAFALANLYLPRRCLTPPGSGVCVDCDEPAKTSRTRRKSLKARNSGAF